MNAQRVFPGHTAPLRPFDEEKRRDGSTIDVFPPPPKFEGPPRDEYLKTCTNDKSGEQLRGVLFFLFISKLTDSCPDYKYLSQLIFTYSLFSSMFLLGGRVPRGDGLGSNSPPRIVVQQRKQGVSIDMHGLSRCFSMYTNRFQ
jgi:hypothetical protein